MNKKWVVLGIIAVIILVMGGFVYHTLSRSGRMIFPKSPRGEFVRQPQMISENGVKKINWILPEPCTYVSYEAQEIGYMPDTGMFWGGKDGVECTEQEDGYFCEVDANVEIQERDSKWNVQAKGYECENGDYYVSEVVALEQDH